MVPCADVRLMSSSSRTRGEIRQSGPSILPARASPVLGRRKNVPRTKAKTGAGTETNSRANIEERSMLTIYHVPGTRGVRPIWLCEELQIPYTVVSVDFSPKFRASAEWRAMNPVGKVPVLRDQLEGQSEDLLIFESGAMVQYILDRYGKGQLQPPPGSPEHALYLQWSWFAEATFARPLGEIVNHSREFPDERRIDDVVAEMQARAELSAKALGDEMSDKPFILGETFSAADIMLGYTVMLAERFLPEGLPDSLLPYWQRLSSRPAYQKAVS